MRTNLAQKVRQANVKFTYHDYLSLSSEKRYELVEGELYVVPAPAVYHQRISGRLFVALSLFVKDNDLGEVLAAPCDVVLSKEDVVQPDILFVAKDREGIIEAANVQGPPDLIVEILSPETKSRDMDIKRKLYAKSGVREYWIIDPLAKTLEVLTWSRTGYRRSATYPRTAQAFSQLFPGLNLPLSEIF
jgi:Uma2 family endonuclease